MGTDALREEAWAAALTMLPGMGPRRLAVLLGRASAAEAWAAVRAGRALDDELAEVCGPRPATVAQRWQHAATVDVAALDRRLRALGVEVAVCGRPGYWPLLADDPEPPVVLFTTGPIEVLAEVPRVAIVGMRNASRYGLDVAQWLGRELAGEGVSVVSGLAAGIDGAAHRGALEPPAPAGVPVAVVASGHDTPYPRRNRALWDAVAERGVVVSEVPPGVRPDAWRFPARNRVIAALADVVVVVESGVRGGSLYTVDEALGRDRPVLVVPGPVDSPTSAGTNALAVAGMASVVRDPDDVLVAVGRARSTGMPARRSRRAGRGGGRLDPTEAALLDALVGGPRPMGALADRLDRPLTELALAVHRLVEAGRVVQRGHWVERAMTSPLGGTP